MSTGEEERDSSLSVTDQPVEEQTEEGQEQEAKRKLEIDVQIQDVGPCKKRLKVAGCPVYFWTHGQVEDYLNRAGLKLSTSEVYGQLFCVESIPI